MREESRETQEYGASYTADLERAVRILREEGCLMRIQDLIDEAEALPVEERALVVDSLLRTLNPPESRIDEKWAEVARKRLSELRSGAVSRIPGEDVFARIWNGRNQ